MAKSLILTLLCAHSKMKDLHLIMLITTTTNNNKKYLYIVWRVARREGRKIVLVIVMGGRHGADAISRKPWRYKTWWAARFSPPPFPYHKRVHVHYSGHVQAMHLRGLLLDARGIAREVPISGFSFRVELPSPPSGQTRPVERGRGA